METQAALHRRKSAETLTKKPENKRKSSPRNPLKDLNCSNSSSRTPPLRSEASRKGCSGSSSETVLPRSKSLAGTPRSAPPNARFLSSKVPSNLSNSRSRVPSKTSSENSNRFPPQNPRKPPNSNLVLDQCVKKPSSGGLVLDQRVRKPSSGGLVLDQRVRKPSSGGSYRDIDARCRGHSAQRGKLSGLSREVVLKGSRSLVPSGLCLVSSPKKTQLGFTSELAPERSSTPLTKLSYGSWFDSTPYKGGEEKSSTTPTATTTPPVQASISPEIVCGSSIVSTPVCYAAGHVIAGVQDRRKCRPRGILNVDGFELGIPDDGCSNKSRVSLSSPTLDGASIQWLTSPSDNANGGLASSASSRFRLADFPGEASVNWLLSPCDEGKDDVLENELVGTDTSEIGSATPAGSDLWSISPADSIVADLPPEVGSLVDLDSTVSESTPSSGHAVWKTPSTGGSLSPYSMILQRAATSSAYGLKVLDPQEGLEGYHNGLAAESWGNRHGICTPSLHSSSKSHVSSSATLEMNSVANAFQTLSSTSPRKQARMHNDVGVTSLSTSSFQFGCPAIPSDSIDLTQCQKSNRVGISSSKKECLSSSGVWISWREGLMSQVFGKDELNDSQLIYDEEEDVARQLSDEEQDVACHVKNELNPKLDVKFDWNTDSLKLTDVNDKPLTSGFGSIEFMSHGQDAKENVPNVPLLKSTTCVESINIEGGELISSGDSDWTLFYKNNLFEV